MLEFRNGDGARKAYVFDIGRMEEERRVQFAATLTRMLRDEAPEAHDVSTAPVTRDFVLRNLTRGAGSADYLVFTE